MKLVVGKNKFSLPVGVLSCVKDATRQDFQVLLTYACNTDVIGNSGEKLSKMTGIPIDEVNASLKFWEENGILSDVPKGITSNASPRKPLKRGGSYTSEEINDLLETRAEYQQMVAESVQILGRMLSFAETGRMIAMMDWMQISPSTMLVILSHCVNIGKKSMSQIESYVQKADESLWSDPNEMNRVFQLEEERHTLVGQVKNLFGLGSRKLSTKEQSAVDKWAEYGFHEDVIKTAYDIAVSGTKGSPTIAYTNAILERWHAEGVTTKAEAEALLAKDAGRKKTKQDGATGLAPDDFIQNAFQRSFAQFQKDRKDGEEEKK